MSSGAVRIRATQTLRDGQTITYADLVTIIEGLIADILPGTITQRELADGAIGADKLDATVASQLGIPDGAVTTAKLANGVLSADSTGRDKMADGFLTGDKIADGTISAAKLAADLYVPTGAIVPFADEAVPSGWLECNGQAVSRTTYAALFAVVGTRWGEGNGTTTFHVPDCRGLFPRGWDHGAGNDPDAASRTASATGGATGDHVGTRQADALKSHAHNFNVKPYANPLPGGGNYLDASGEIVVWTEAEGGSETRPKNFAVMFAIKT
jgi:hypothetical protein